MVWLVRDWLMFIHLFPWDSAPTLIIYRDERGKNPTLYWQEEAWKAGENKEKQFAVKLGQGVWHLLWSRQVSMGQREGQRHLELVSRRVPSALKQIHKKNALKRRMCGERVCPPLWLGIYNKLQAQGHFLFWLHSNFLGSCSNQVRPYICSNGL